jgi:hypothetical protein
MRAKRASSMDLKTIKSKVVYCLEILPPTSEDLDQSLQILECVRHRCGVSDREQASNDDDGCSSKDVGQTEGGQAAGQALYAYLSLGICWDERLKRNFILLLASPAGSRHGRGKRRSRRGGWGDQTHGRNATKGNEEVGLGGRHEVQRLDWQQLMYYTISRAFIGIPGIIVSYSFPHTLCSKKKRRKNSQQYAAQS